MIVTVAYTFHDDEPEIFTLDTSRLDTDHVFEAAVKEALEGDEDFITLEGSDFEDSWGDLDKAKTVLPARVEKQKILQVSFDC